MSCAAHVRSPTARAVPTVRAVLAGAPADARAALCGAVVAGAARGWWHEASGDDAWVALHVADAGMERVLLVAACGGEPPEWGDALVVAPLEVSPALLRGMVAGACRARVIREALDGERARHRFLLDACALGDWDMDVGRNETRRSPRHDQLFGYETMQASWGYDDFLAHVHPEDRVRVDAVYQRALAGDGEYDVEFRVPLTDGRTRWLRSRGRFVLQDGRVLRAAGVVADVSAHKMLEEQIRELNREELVGRVAARLSHDFNNLLSVMLGGTEFALAEPGLPPAAHADLMDVRRAAQRSAALVRQLLTLSRRDAVIRRHFDLVRLVREQEVLLRHLLGESIVLAVEVPPGTLIVSGDRGRLEEALLNLCVNARDAMPHGGTLTFAVRVASAGVAELRVADTGTGMSPEVLARCREAFFTTKPAGAGTGIGLASVEAAVTQMGGSLAIRSAVDAGTEVVLRLPVPDGTVPEALGEPPDDACGRPLDGWRSDAIGEKRHVLLVDADPQTRAMARRALQRSGLSVHEVATGEAAACHIVTAERLDVLVADAVLPGMEGEALATVARRRFPDAQVLLVSRHGREDPANGYAVLARPFGPQTLVARVLELLGASPT